MDAELEKEIREIIGDLRCPKDFKCYRSGFENLCKATQVDGVVSYLECLEEDPKECVFSRYVSVGDSSFYLCACPLRKYIAGKKTPEK
jgi:hypothetical protein